VNSGAPEGYAVPAPLVAPVKPNIVNVYQNTVIVLATHVSI
jgi:hypothetical protein